MALIELKKVSKYDKQQVLLNNVQLNIEAGKCLGIKCQAITSSTLFDIIEQKTKPSSGGVVFHSCSVLSKRKDDGFYEKMTVGSYLQMFAVLSAVNSDSATIQEDFALNDLLEQPIHSLSVGQKNRLALARMLLFQPDILLIENPLHDLTSSETEILLRAFQKLLAKGMSLLLTSSYLEELALITEHLYVYDDEGLRVLEIEEANPQTNTVVTELDEKQSVLKISCKIEDKILLFNPNEIAYIESMSGTSQVYVAGVAYPSPLKISELDDKLKNFGFFRCHRSYLVNLQKVREIMSFSRNSYTLVLADTEKTMIPLSRTRLDEMKQILDF
ncbi:LytTR family transcriptional regulator DNA-binding domain-containing protein [Isobaculum melis]|uniref:Transcriptional regulator, LytTR family n=1 Tax=Isobaculum melis TaxID=142588 RepID=A0A1H9PZU4_9LACT|nr:LytTR family transcriptional regulator DNA-binding domain-containing protein [Isobaculum melis]SER53816.1 transcriptional regulator, LytTR family [Isobaculum melis]